MPLLFWTLTLLCCLYVGLAGGWVGRWAVSIFVGTAAATFVGNSLFGEMTAKVGLLLVIDGSYLVALCGLAKASRRFWPIWAAGFQLASVVGLLIPHIDAALLPRLYRSFEAVWAIPILISMAVGVRLDRRAGLIKSRKREHAYNGH